MQTIQKPNFNDFYGLEYNTINIFSPINTMVSGLVIGQLQYLQHKFEQEGVEEKDRIITIQIQSPGGEINAGLAIYDTIKHLEAKKTTIVTVALGMVASMAVILLVSGSLRKTTQHTTFLIHQPLIESIGGTTSDVLITAEQLKNLRKVLSTIIAKETKKEINKVIKDTERDYYLDANQAKEYGLIHEIIDE